MLPELGCQEELCQLQSRELEICSSAAGAEATAESVPCGGEGSWRKPGSRQAQPCREPLLLLLLSYLGNATPAKCVSAFVNREQWFTWLAKKSRNGSRWGIPRGGRVSQLSLCQVWALPGERGLLWPQGDAELVWLSPHGLSGDAHWEWQTLCRSICSESAGAGVIKQCCS